MKNSERINSFLLFLGVITVLTARPLWADQETPTLEKVLDEGIAAAKFFAKREANADDGAYNGYVARGLLTFALLRAGRRQEVDELFSDEKEKQQLIGISEALLVEVTGVVPKIPSGMDSTAELIHRQTISMSLARRGDYESAWEQIAAFPKHPKRFAWVIRSYKFVAERQLEKGDLAGARQTVRKSWPQIRDLKIDDDLRRTEWIIELATLTSQAGEQRPAKSLCETADKKLAESILNRDGEPERINAALRDLSVAYASCGNADRAKLLLEQYERRGKLIDENRAAEFQYALETARAKVADLAGEKTAALAAYARALPWAKKINHDQLAAFADNTIDATGFVSGLLALGLGSDFRTVALGQLKAGDKQAALKTLKQMPRCWQKPATLLEMAKILNRNGATDEAREMAARCAKLDDSKTPATDHAMITIFVVNIHRALGDDEAANAAAKQLIASPRIQGSLQAKQMAAGELVTLKMFAGAYAVIQTIGQPADRALPLAKLAEGLAKQQ